MRWLLLALNVIWTAYMVTLGNAWASALMGFFTGTCLMRAIKGKW